MFIFCFVWSFGASTDVDGKLGTISFKGSTSWPASGRKLFDSFVRGMMQGQFEETLQDTKFEMQLPEESSCFDFLFECKGKGMSPSVSLSPSLLAPLFEIIILSRQR